MLRTLVRIMSFIVIVVFLFACAGREPHPITSIQLDDEQKSCEALVKEMKQNEEDNSKLGIEKHGIIKGNIIKGVLAPFTLGVSLFFLDVTGAPQVEQTALDKRNERLNDIYLRKCFKNQPVVSRPSSTI